MKKYIVEFVFIEDEADIRTPVVEADNIIEAIHHVEEMCNMYSSGEPFEIKSIRLI
ncbi:MAG: hypothetical protein K1W18_07190 [Oscillospiraceae bacterium]